VDLNFSVKVDQANSVPVVTISGELDVYSCPELRKILVDLVEKHHHTNLILDLESIRYIDSTGLGTIASTAQSLQQKSSTVFVLCTKPQIKRIFQISGLDKKNIKLIDHIKDAG